MGNSAYTSLPAERALDAIGRLALDLRSTWNSATSHIWNELDPALWELTRNPWLILQAVSRERLERVLADDRLRESIDREMAHEEALSTGDAWFQRAHAGSPLSGVVYFSMEYMLSEALPIYSGGLGNVAGDQLKAASDLGVPVHAIGLLYQQGYFRQEFGADGEQLARYPFNDPGQLPITPLRKENGDWLRLEVKLPGYTVWVRAWQAHVGRCKLYLLDTNDPVNAPGHRTITSELYGGDKSLRLEQEIVLGIGGWRLVQALGFKAEVCHLNEGHAAFAILDRAHSFMSEHGVNFATALAATRAGNLFTTHTPVEAGFDRFSPELVERYLKRYAEQDLQISLQDLLALGRRNAGDRGEPFNMAYLALHGSGAVNGVSRLHGEVSRRLFQPLFPRWPEGEVPVRHVTNGVHVPTWQSPQAGQLWSSACGPEPWSGEANHTECVLGVADEALWQMRNESRAGLIDYVRQRLQLVAEQRGASREEAAGNAHRFEPGHLTLGFARRFATYKRPTLLLYQPERLIRLLMNPERPVQLILAGKAHPADQAGQDLVQEWNRFLREHPELHGRVAFLSDYDMLLTEELVAGVDVWLNTPRRPWEASGTSGMKVLANGGLNLSELDGWWAEAYTSETGWAIGDGNDRGDDAGWDLQEADQLFRILEQEVVPQFYERDGRGIPVQWLARMRASMAHLTAQYSASRTVGEYTELHYLPLAAAYRERSAQGGEPAKALLAWRERLAAHWHEIRFGAVGVADRDDHYHFQAQVNLGSVAAADVQVQVYANRSGTQPEVKQALTATRLVDGYTTLYLYEGQVAGGRPQSDYTLRVVPHHEHAFVPLEAAMVTWQR